MQTKEVVQTIIEKEMLFLSFLFWWNSFNEIPQFQGVQIFVHGNFDFLPMESVRLVYTRQKFKVESVTKPSLFVAFKCETFSSLTSIMTFSKRQQIYIVSKEIMRIVEDDVNQPRTHTCAR